MSEYENIFRRKELHDMYAAGEVKSLDDIMLLEDVALTIREIDKEKDHYKAYKKKKSQDISDAIKVLDNKINFYKSIMVSTLKSKNEKGFKFPGSCNVSARNQKEKWVVQDEEEFIAVLKEAQKSGENVDDVLEKVVQFNVRKREASKLLAIWESSGKLEGFLKKARKGSGDIVTKEPSKITISIKFLDEELVEEVEEIKIVPKKADLEPVLTNVEDYDSI